MPLDRESKVIRGIQLHRLNHPIFWRDSAHQQLVARNADRLMVAWIDQHLKLFSRGKNPAQSRSLRNSHRMRLNDFATRPVIDRGLQVAIQVSLQVLDE